MAVRPVRIALDSSYLIALLSDWHARHHETLRSYERYRDRNAQIVLPVHALLECYSVLTRLPAPYRLRPDVARQVIEDNFSNTPVVGVKAGAIWDCMERLASLGLGGGQVYDALIAWCAMDAGASLLLTWDLKHFSGIVPRELEVREP